MQYSMALTAALVAGASANYNGSISYTTEIVDQYTTYCPGATQITHAEKTYTVTEATLLTITNCPCTLTKPVSSFVPVTSVPVVSSSAASVVVISSSAAPVVSSAAPVVVSSAAPVVTSSAAAVVVVSSSAAPVVTSVATVAAPVVASTAVVAPIFANSTAAVVAPVGTAASSVSPATPSVSAFKGAANHVAASGFGLAGVLAIAAYLL